MQNFKEFWPFYLSQHSNATNRRIHFAGTLLVHLLVLYAFITGLYAALWGLPLLGYGFAWAGHFFVEKNKPATFTYPFWSLIGDFKMFYLMCTGKLWN